MLCIAYKLQMACSETLLMPIELYIELNVILIQYIKLYVNIKLMFKYSNRYNSIDKSYKIGSLNELERKNKKPTSSLAKMRTPAR